MEAKLNPALNEAMHRAIAKPAWMTYSIPQRKLLSNFYHLLSSPPPPRNKERESILEYHARTDEYSKTLEKAMLACRENRIDLESSTSYFKGKELSPILTTLVAGNFCALKVLLNNDFDSEPKKAFTGSYFPHLFSCLMCDDLVKENTSKNTRCQLASIAVMACRSNSFKQLDEAVKIIYSEEDRNDLREILTEIKDSFTSVSPSIAESYPDKTRFIVSTLERNINELARGAPSTQPSPIAASSGRAVPLAASSVAASISPK